MLPLEIGPQGAALTLCDFVAECAADLDTGQLKRLAEYLHRYPGHEEDIAREYLALVDPQATRAAEGLNLGRYVVVRKLARGGQGVVYLGRDRQLGRAVVLKVLDAHGSYGMARRLRFRRELEALARIDHPHVCRLFEADADHDPPYVAIELVPGRTLRQHITAARAGRPANRIVAPRTAAARQAWLRFFEATARGLAAVHATGVIHRDVKPENLMVTPPGEPRVLDFGLAKTAADPVAVTMTDELPGTLPYMAPEQLAPHRQVDARTDVFALGVTMFETLTLALPFSGQSLEARLADLARGPKWPVRVARDLRAVLDKALAEDPAQRYATALQLACDLRAAREQRPIIAQRPSRTRAALRWCRRHPWFTAWLMVVAAVALLNVLAARRTSRSADLAQARGDALLQALAALDPWGKGARDTVANAVANLAAVSNADPAPDRAGVEENASFANPRSVLADVVVVHLRAGDGQAALAALDQSGNATYLDGLRLAGLVLVQRMADAHALLAKHRASLAAVIAPCEALAGAWYRAGRWSPFDTLVGGLLALTEDPGAVRAGQRIGLLSWDLRAAILRGRIGRATTLLAGEVARLRQHLGKGSVDDLTQRAELLAVGLALLGTAPQLITEVLRGMAASLARDAVAAAVPARLALRIQTLAAHARANHHTEHLQKLTEGLAQQRQVLGPAHRDALETSVWLADKIYETDFAQSAALLAEAVTHLPELPGQEIELRALVLHRHARALTRQERDADAQGLRRQAAQLRMRLWGPGDPRTWEALCEPPLELAGDPQAQTWLRQMLLWLQADRDRPNELAVNALAAALGSAYHQGDDWPMTERLALEIQRRVPDLGHWQAREAREALARRWVWSHKDLHGDALALAFKEQAEVWLVRLHGQGATASFVPAVLFALGDSRAQSGWRDDMDAAYHYATFEFAALHRVKAEGDWRQVLLALPIDDPLVLLAVEHAAAACWRFGEDDAALALWRRILGSADPGGHRERRVRRALGQLLTKRGDYPAAERELNACLERELRRGEGNPGVRPTRRSLLALYRLWGKTDQAAPLAALLKD